MYNYGLHLRNFKFIIWKNMYKSIVWMSYCYKLANYETLILEDQPSAQKCFPENQSV